MRGGGEGTGREGPNSHWWPFPAGLRRNILTGSSGGTLPIGTCAPVREDAEEEGAAGRRREEDGGGGGRWPTCHAFLVVVFEFVDRFYLYDECMSQQCVAS